MKLRIIHKNGYYYPQVRCFGIWGNIYEKEKHEINSYFVERNTLKQAEEFIMNYIKEKGADYSVIREYKVSESARDTGMK